MNEFNYTAAFKAYLLYFQASLQLKRMVGDCKITKEQYDKVVETKENVDQNEVNAVYSLIIVRDSCVETMKEYDGLENLFDVKKNKKIVEQMLKTWD